MFGRERSELTEGLWSFPVGRSYLLFYRPEPGGIQLVRVLHGARDLPSLFPEADPHWLPTDPARPIPACPITNSSGRHELLICLSRRAGLIEGKHLRRFKLL